MAVGADDRRNDVSPERRRRTDGQPGLRGKSDIEIHRDGAVGPAPLPQRQEDCRAGDAIFGRDAPDDLWRRGASRRVNQTLPTDEARATADEQNSARHQLRRLRRVLGHLANPALGYASDLVVRCGGTSVLAEIPECMGAEHLLTRRAVDEATGRKVIDVMNWYQN